MIFSNMRDNRWLKICATTVLAWMLVVSGPLLAAARQQTVVKDAKMLHKSIKNAAPGDEIIMANGVWKDLQIEFFAHGDKANPIVLKAETPGKVMLEGMSSLKLGGEYLVVSGLIFQHGHTTSSTVIDFRINKDSVANNCSVASCVIWDYNQPERFIRDHWIEFWGRHNKLDHCYLAGKSNEGPTLLVNLAGNENIRNFHEITNNYFGPRPRKGGPKAETIRMGSSYTSMTPAHVNVANNLFDHCNGEVEVISNKSNDNVFSHNIFYECEGSLVLRHGNYCTVDGNIFIGNHKPFVGGIRVINTGHWITNNYFYGMIGDEFRAPLAVMNGIPKSPLNRYNQVTDVVVAFNTWVDCKSPWQFSVGFNADKKGTLPASEIRSARPLRTLIADNLIFNHHEDKSPVVAYDKIGGISFHNNILDNAGSEVDVQGALKLSSVEMVQKNKWFYMPSKDGFEALKDVYAGFDFQNIKTDILGVNRAEHTAIGALGLEADQTVHLDKSKFGPSWFPGKNKSTSGREIRVSSKKGALQRALETAKDGDELILTDKNYMIANPLSIDKKITVRALSSSKPVIHVKMESSQAIELQPGSHLILRGVNMIGVKNAVAFSTPKHHNNKNYNLHVENVAVSGFGKIMQVYKGSFADTISFDDVKFADCGAGIGLDAETDDKGDYNAEVLQINKCTFENIGSEVIDYYRGGYDESTIGGSLILRNSMIAGCGKAQQQDVLVSTHGIINVLIEGNTFKDNDPANIAVLWGEKNNHARDNQFENSGEIVTEKYLKQKQIY